MKLWQEKSFLLEGRNLRQTPTLGGRPSAYFSCSSGLLHQHYLVWWASLQLKIIWEKDSMEVREMATNATIIHSIMVALGGNMDKGQDCTGFLLSASICLYVSIALCAALWLPIAVTNSLRYLFCWRICRVTAEWAKQLSVRLNV